MEMSRILPRYVKKPYFFTGEAIFQQNLSPIYFEANLEATNRLTLKKLLTQIMGLGNPIFSLGRPFFNQFDPKFIW